MENEKMNIYQRINEVRKKVNYAKKDKEVKGQGYKAVTHDMVTALLRNSLIEHGIVIVPRLLDSDITQVGETKNGAPIIRYAGRYEVEFVNADNPSDKVTVRAEAHANDHGDKAPGKATSYVTKYAMLKLFSIETGEDDESRIEGYEGREPINDKQASTIIDLIAASETNTEKFLKWIGAESVETIPQGKYKQALTQLERKVKAAGEPV